MKSLLEILPHVCGMTEAARKARLFLMLKAFFDESSDDKKVFLVAGWLGQFTEWENFTIAWDRECKTPPSINYFKHYEALRLCCQFEGWSESDRNAKILSLARIVSGYKLRGFVNFLALKDFNSIFSLSILSRRNLRKILKITDPYHYCCLRAIEHVIARQILVEKNLEDIVDFVFDDGVPALEDCIYRYMKGKPDRPSEYRAIAGIVVPGNDKQIAALQAADLLAGTHLSEMKFGKNEALEIMRSNPIHYDSPNLEKVEDHMKRCLTGVNLMWLLQNHIINGGTLTIKQFENFEKLVSQVLGVSHTELVARGEEYKKNKEKRKKSKKSSASREEDDRA